MNTDKKPEEKKKEVPENKIWNDSEVDILKSGAKLLHPIDFYTTARFEFFK